MRNVDDLRSELEKLSDLERWDQCLEIFDLIEKQAPLTAQELIRKSACIQLGSSEHWSLDDAEQALKGALDLASEYVPALIDLGWFYYAVRDDAETGLGYFNKAEEISRAALKEARRGEKKCLEELQEQ